jgi:hypothetical protein
MLSFFLCVFSKGDIRHVALYYSVFQGLMAQKNRADGNGCCVVLTGFFLKRSGMTKITLEAEAGFKAQHRSVDLYSFISFGPLP